MISLIARERGRLNEGDAKEATITSSMAAAAATSSNTDPNAGTLTTVALSGLAGLAASKGHILSPRATEAPAIQATGGNVPPPLVPVPASMMLPGVQAPSAALLFSSSAPVNVLDPSVSLPIPQVSLAVKMQLYVSLLFVVLLILLQRLYIFICRYIYTNREYYFSVTNLIKDIFLRSHMDEQAR